MQNGEDNGIALWYGTSNNFRLSIFHSGGTQESFPLGSGVIPNNGTLFELRGLIYDNSGTLTLKLWLNDSIVLNTTSTNLIEGFKFQVGQFKGSASTRWNRLSVTGDEGIREATVWKVNKLEEPSEAEVLALEPVAVPFQKVQRYNTTGVTGINGYIAYFPDEASVGLPNIHYFGGSDEFSYTLKQLSNTSFSSWLKSNDIPFAVFHYRSTATGWESGRVENAIEAITDSVSGTWKDRLDLAEINTMGYSAGAIGVSTFIGDQGANVSRIKNFILQAGNLSSAYTYTDEIFANGSKLWIFCSGADANFGVTTSIVLADQGYANEPTKIRITNFTSLSHAEMQDQVYNGAGIGEAQETGSTAGGTPYTEFNESIYNWL